MMGRTIGSRTVLAQAPRRKGRHETYWLTRCVCGFEAEVSGVQMRKGIATKCQKCANHSNPHHVAVRAGVAASEARCTSQDSFGEKKREIQRMFWSVVPTGPALVFVDGSITEWRIMLEAGFSLEHCAIVADTRYKLGHFVERCNFQNLPLPKIRKGFNLMTTCSRGRRRVPVTQWLQTELEARGQSAFSVAHLDFCGALKGAQSVIDTFLRAGLLAESGILAITISYRGDNWLTIWHTLVKFMDAYGLEPWFQRTPYADTKTPMLFSTFQKKGTR